MLDPTVLKMMKRMLGCNERHLLTEPRAESGLCQPCEERRISVNHEMGISKSVIGSIPDFFKLDNLVQSNDKPSTLILTLNVSFEPLPGASALRSLDLLAELTRMVSAQPLPVIHHSINVEVKWRNTLEKRLQYLRDAEQSRFFVVPVANKRERE